MLIWRMDRVASAAAASTTPCLRPRVPPGDDAWMSGPSHRGARGDEAFLAERRRNDHGRPTEVLAFVAPGTLPIQ